MKRILFFLYIVTFSFSFFVFVDWISNKQEDAMKQAGKEDSFIITINETALKVDSERFLSILFTVSDEYSANIFKSSYSENNLTDYIYLTYDTNAYFSHFSLLNGGLPYNNKLDEFNLSTSQDKMVTGRIFTYKKGVNFSIQPLRLLPKDKPVSGSYVVSLKDKTKIHSYIDNLQRDLGITIPYSTYEIQRSIDSSWLKIVPIILLYVLSLLTTIYYYFLEYKNSAVRLLNGYGTIDIWKKYFYEICIVYFLAAFISTIAMIFITVGNLFFTSYWLEMIKNYLIFQFIVGMVFCFIMSFLFLRVGKISISESIKNKKPLKQIQFINGIVKVIFSIIILYLLFVSYLTFSDSYRYYYKNAKEWEQMKSYGIMPTMSLLPSGKDPRAILEMFDQKYKLFKYTNDRGAILIDFSDAYKAKQDGIELGVSKYAEKAILINNNYLKLNPIYTTNNKPIIVDENDDQLTVLVPEKYKNEEKELRTYLEKEYYLQKYKVKNSFLKDAGENLPSVENTGVNIVWVKNNQSYFTFSNDIARETDNRFYDGIGMVLTNNNCNEAAWYDTVVGSDGYFIKLTDKKEPYNSIKNQIELLDLQKYYPRLFNAYDRIENTIQMHLERTYQFLVILSVVLLAYLFISVFTTLNYLEQHKFKHTIQTIHGYPYFKRHKVYLISINLIWGMAILATCIFGEIDFIYLILSVFLLENLLIYLLIKRNEQKKLIQIIKEG